MKEILPGILHWSAKHPKIQIAVSSYYVAEAGVLIDPLVPPDGPGSVPPSAAARLADKPRPRYGELPRDRSLALCCGVGQRAYYAVRFLAQHGYRVANLSGGLHPVSALHGAGVVRA